MDTKLSSPKLQPESQTVTLTPEMSFREAGYAVLTCYLNQLLANESDSINHDSPTAFHDLRVATRRLRAALRVFRSAFDREQMRQLERDTRWLGTLVGRIRDLDVFLDWLRDYVAALPESERPCVRRVIKEREAMRARQRAAFLAGLHSARYQTFCANFQRLLDEADNGAPGGDGTLTERAGAKIGRELQRVIERAHNADKGHPQRLHRLRIETKRLRYTAQFFRSLYPDRLKKLIDRAGQVQDTLGGFHDAEMQIEFLKEMRRVQASDTEMRDALKAMIAQRKSEQAAYYDDFRDTYRKLSSKKIAREIKRETADPSQVTADL